MGLSSKQVISSDGHGWNNNNSHQGLLEGGNLELHKPPSSMKRQSSNQLQQQQQQQAEQLKCPRCDSTNTKFCYYNNYNKSQPRHFCKACKRHWTKGGTLRNVPAGGGRKNKRLKTSNTPNKTASKNTSTTTTLFSGVTCNYNNNTTIQSQQQPRLGLPLTTLGGDKNFSEAFYQTLGRQPCSSLPESSVIGNNEVFLGSTLSLLQNDQDPEFPYANLGIFESNPCSISANGLENTSLSSSSMSDHQYQNWEIPTSNEAMDLSSNWGWDDFDKFVSVEPDLTIPWDYDAEIKP